MQAKIITINNEAYSKREGIFLTKIYNCNYKKLIPPLTILIIMFAVGPVLLLRFTRLTNSLPSIFVLIIASILLSERFFHELTLKAQVSDNGISFRYTKEWKIIKWESIERIEYKKSFRYEWIIIHYPYEKQLLLTAYIKQYPQLWKEIYDYLEKCNSKAIVDEQFLILFKTY